VRLDFKRHYSIAFCNMDDQAIPMTDDEVSVPGAEEAMPELGGDESVEGGAEAPAEGADEETLA